MKLNLEQIKSITKGAARIVSDNGKVKFMRFTEEQEKFYERNADFYRKTFATAGVRLEFVTNSRSLSIKVDASPASSREWFSLAIHVNGEMKHTLDASLSAAPDKHVTAEGSYALGTGKKTVCIYMPWSVCAELISLELDNGATLEPVSHKIKILMFGDSITHGYDAKYPSEAYSSLITDALDAEGLNKGIGADKFNAPIGGMAESYVPDIITVAYGTNDWSGGNRERFERESRGFYTNLSKTYPDSKIFALAPIWRGNWEKVTGVGKFEDVEKTFSDIAKDIPNMTVINCIDFVPHSAEMFSPDVLHPNSLGFSHYAKGLVKAINELIK